AIGGDNGFHSRACLLDPTVSQGDGNTNILEMKYFEELILDGNWIELDSYLSGFTKFDENKHSRKIFFEIRKQQYLEALDNKDHHKALDILVTYLEVFSQFDEDTFREMAYLLTLNDFREHDKLSNYGDAMSARIAMKDEVQKIIEANPSFHGKLQFPCIEDSRLQHLINHSLNWQHTLCEYPSLNPKVKTLFEDHICQEPSESTTLMNSNTSASASALPSSQNSSPPASTHSVASHGPSGSNFPQFPAAAVHKGPNDIPNMSGICSTAVMDKSHKISDKLDDLPCTVGHILDVGSHPTSMDFHPIKHTSLLVGTNNGDIELWDVVHGTKLSSRNFKVWDTEFCSMAFQIDAHIGSGNDLAIYKPEWELLVITCGDDKLVKVWDVAMGNNLFTFEAQVPVYSHLEPQSPYAFLVQFILSTAIDGEIKLWLHENRGPLVEFYAPSQCCMTMVFSMDGRWGRRLFSCGTAKSGKSIIVEWHETEGGVRSSYEGLGENSSGIMHFDTAKNLLAAGDEFLIKFWDMDTVELLTTIDADGGLPENPNLCLNKEGTLLAVSANNNKVKILADKQGIQMLQKLEYDMGRVIVPVDLSES
ncbi:hypothetical protein RJ641_006173, partial [Dillenia turbinata]